MTFSVNALKTVEECDSLLNMANKQKADLLVKQAGLQFKETRYQETAVEVEAEIRMVLAELAFLDGLLPALPDGPKKAGYLNDRHRQEARLFQLNTKKANSGIFALLDKQQELAKLENQLYATDLFIAAITTRREELVAGSS